jgi:acetyl esterase/lipase
LAQNYDGVLPPTLLTVGTAEVFLEESRIFSKKNPNVVLKEYHDMQHQFQMLYELVPESQQGIEDIAAFLKTVFKI